MKSLIISIVCLLILIVPWLIYDRYSTNAIENYTEILNEKTIPAIEEHDWLSAEKSFEHIIIEWHRFENISEFFLDTSSVNEAGKLIATTKQHIKLHDMDSAVAGSTKLIHIFRYLHENERLTTGNIF